MSFSVWGTGSNFDMVEVKEIGYAEVDRGQIQENHYFLNERSSSQD